jgi:hypothetical protein
MDLQSRITESLDWNGIYDAMIANLELQFAVSYLFNVLQPFVEPLWKPSAYL